MRAMALPTDAAPQKAVKPPPPGVGFVLDITVQRLTKLAILVAIIAWALTREFTRGPSRELTPSAYVGWTMTCTRAELYILICAPPSPVPNPLVIRARH